MFSCPPDTTTSASPQRIACTPRIILVIPEPQTLFTVRAGLASGIPDFMATCLAGFCPQPAVRTCPIITSSTSAGFKLILFSNSLTTETPRSMAETDAITPPKEPIAVRPAATITTSFMKNTPKLL